MLQVIKYKWAWLAFSGALVAASIVLFATWGLKPGIDFTGGSLLHLGFGEQGIEKAQLQHTLESLSLGNSKLQPGDSNDYFIRTRFLSAQEYQQVVDALQAGMPEGARVEEKRFEIIGPSIGKELTQKAWQAIVAVLIAIILFIAWSFRGVSYPVTSWKYGLTAIIALFHDIAIPVGVFVLLGRFMNVEIDILFITALLAILGYSVNDTIIVFDRIRENLLHSKEKDFKEVVNISVNQSIGRSINTSGTLFVVLLAVYLFGGTTTQYFILTLLIGVVAGTYSSVFIASPLLVVWQELADRKHR